MSITNSSDKVFYLGFNKDTGELVDVVPTAGKELIFGPNEFKELHNNQISGDRRDVLKKQLNALRGQIRNSAIPAKRLVLVDDPNQSICGGSCGGIPFKIC